MLAITILALTTLIWSLHQMGLTSAAWRSALSTVAVVTLCIALPDAQVLLNSYIGLAVVAALWALARAGIGWAMGPQVARGPKTQSMAWAGGGWTVAVMVSTGG